MMEEILKLIRVQIEEEAKKGDMSPQLIIELADTYRRLKLYSADVGVAEVVVGDESSRGRQQFQNPRQLDHMSNELLSALKTFKNLTAPQEVNAILDLRRHYEGLGNLKMLTLIDNSIRRKTEDLIGPVPVESSP